MSTANITIASEREKTEAITIIQAIEPNGKLKVTIGPSGNKSAKQRGLQWKWFTEVSQAGIGGKHEDTKEGVALVAKWRWAIPILIRDDEFFADLFVAYRDKWGNDEAHMRYFVDVYVHTEQFNTSQMAEFLTEFQNHYSPIVNLTDPQEGLTE